MLKKQWLMRFLIAMLKLRGGRARALGSVLYIIFFEFAFTISRLGSMDGLDLLEKADEANAVAAATRSLL